MFLESVLYALGSRWLGKQSYFKVAEAIQENYCLVMLHSYAQNTQFSLQNVFVFHFKGLISSY